MPANWPSRFASSYDTAATEIYTCDLTCEYVRLNAEYTT